VTNLQGRGDAPAPDACSPSWCAGPSAPLPPSPSRRRDPPRATSSRGDDGGRVGGARRATSRAQPPRRSCGRVRARSIPPAGVTSSDRALARAADERARDSESRDVARCYGHACRARTRRRRMIACFSGSSSPSSNRRQMSRVNRSSAGRCMVLTRPHQHSTTTAGAGDFAALGVSGPGAGRYSAGRRCGR